MPTYAFNLTREQLARKVLGKLGVLDPFETPPAHELFAVTDAMDLRLKELHALGVLWFNVAPAQTAIVLTAGVATATIAAADFLLPVSLMLSVGTDQQPVEIIGHADYQAITDKASQGEPERAFVSGSTIYLYPVPRQAYTLRMTYQAIAEDTSTAAPLDLGAGMARAFVDVVAADLIDDFGVDEPRASRLLARQAQGMAVLRTLNAQRTDSTTIAPDYF